MIPTLYDKTGNNKIGDLNDCIECFVEEERNGIFELTMIYPANSSILESIVYDNIIVADANDYLKSQKFRVYNTRKLMANRIEVCARHISFDLVHDWVDVISIENQSCEYALNTIFRNSQFSKHFKGHSDIVNAQNFKVNKVTCLEAIGGTDGSIIDTYGTGAEILRDNTDIHVLNRRGYDNDVVIEYRKNLTGLEVEEDTTDLVTRIMPYAIYTNSNNEEVEVRGDFINSPLINNYAHPYVKYMDYSEEFEDGEVPTKTKLNNLATKEYTINKIDIPKCNYKIEFIPLSKCAGYEGLEDRINLCDVVTVKDSRYNIDTQAKVIKVVFDVLRGRYDSMELGEPRTTLGDIIGGTGDGPIQGPPGPPGPQGPAGADGSIGDFPETLPEVPNITAKVYGFANIELSWTFENKVYYSYELYASKTKGFTPNAFNLIFSGQASTYLYQAEPNETWYFRACALNTHGQRTEFSEEVEVSTVKISDLSNYVESAAIGDALIGELNLGRGWYGELRGNYIDAKQMSVTDGNGKRTLDIDSFGNVNLDVASLKIKNNSVATESFVSTAKDEAINSANNTMNATIANYYTKSETNSQINVAKNEINQSVSSAYATKSDVNSSINGVNSSISNLQTRMNTAESKITDNAITNVVKKNFYTKEETNNQITSKGYQTASQVQQTVDQLQIKFTESGGYNLFLNSKFNNGHGAYWWNQQHNNPQGSCNFLNHTSDWGFPDSGVNTIEYILPVGKSNVEWGVSQQVKVAIGKKYTVSFYYASHRCTSANLIIRQPDGYWLTNHAWNPSEYSGGRGSANNWGYKTFTFTAKHEIYQIQIVMNNCSDSSTPGYLWIAKPMCEEGSIASAWSPAPNEVSDGITTINKDGITVSQSNINTKTTMNASGFYINKNGQGDVFKVDTNGLAITGKITSNEVIMANGGMYTGQAVRGTNANGFVVVGSNGDTTFRSDTGQVYLQTNDEVKVTAPSNPNAFKNLRANNIYVNNDFYATRDATVNRNLNVNGEIVAVGSLTSNSNIHLGNNGLVNIRWGYGVVRVNASGQPLYLQCHDEIKCTKPADPSTYTSLRAYNLMAQSKVYANGVALTSSRDKKKNIELYEESALQQILQTKIYRYHLLDDLDEEMKRIGIILQEAPVDAIDIEGVGVDLYQMVTMAWKAIQELKQEIDKREALEKRMETLEEEIRQLKTTF